MHRNSHWPCLLSSPSGFSWRRSAHTTRRSIHPIRPSTYNTTVLNPSEDGLFQIKVQRLLSVCCPKESMKHQMILRIVYLEHYRYWITLNRGRLQTDHKTNSDGVSSFFRPGQFLLQSKIKTRVQRHKQHLR